MKKIIIVLFLIFFINPVRTYADYVLPYPSFMPGSKFYQIEKVKEKLEEFWSWGSLSSFKYNLQLADKYLVEAKTLFEYKQYPLALNALKRSNTSFQKLSSLLIKASHEGKDISVFSNALKDASLKHQEILTVLSSSLPSHFNWVAERENPQNLPIFITLEKSLKIRRKI